MQIAVFLDSEKHPSAPHEASQIAFYTKHNGAWTETGLKAIQPLKGTSTFLVTAFVEQLALLTADAQAVAGASISGMAYSVFNRAGKHIFEISEVSPAQISGMAEDIALAEAQKKLNAEAFARVMPVETDIAGVYTMDLVTVQEEFPDMSSKMILKPFFKNTPFFELSIICRHVPPWLSYEPGLNVSEKSRGEYRVVTVTKAVCKEASE